MATTKTAYDINVFGGVDSSGIIKQDWGQNALSNSIILWLGLSKGEVLRRPTEGGVLTAHIGKLMNDDRAKQIKDDIYFGLTDFTPKLSRIEVEVTPLYESRCWRIQAKAWSPEIKEIAEVDISVKNQ